ncbi:MAG: hypothetical protein KKI02_09370 [Planctomycetes bacterium]|nr:hypothetical protein [Planctomycetota bacterium]
MARTRKCWHDKLRRSLRDAMNGAIVCGVQSTLEIYADKNLQRFTSLASFRRYATRIRRIARPDGARGRGRAAAGILYAFGLSAATARRHGIEVKGGCAECGRPASHVVVYSTGRHQALCRVDFAKFVGALLRRWSERGRT